MRKAAGIILVLFGVFLFFPAEGWAKSPRDTLEPFIENIVQIFEKYSDADLESPKQQEALKEDLSSIAEEVFSYPYMVMASLGRHRQDFNREQQEQMLNLFPRLIEDTYFRRLMQNMDGLEGFSGDMISLTGEEVFSDRKAEVRSVIHYQDKKIPVNYRMVSWKDQGWQVYDIRVEDFSLLSNYRSQFRDLLNKKSVDEFLDLLRQKVEGDESPEELELEPESGQDG